MTVLPLKEVIEKFVDDYIGRWSDIFLVEAIVKHDSNKITVWLDGDNGIGIDKCAEVNRVLYKYVEEDQLFGEANFSIEVSSPGLDKPLKLLRQYKKNVGRKISVIKEDGSEFEGRLLSVSDDGIEIDIEEPKKKKKTDKKEVINVPFTEIRQVKVLVSF